VVSFWGFCTITRSVRVSSSDKYGLVIIIIIIIIMDLYSTFRSEDREVLDPVQED